MSLDILLILECYLYPLLKYTLLLIFLSSGNVYTNLLFVLLLLLFK